MTFICNLYFLLADLYSISLAGSKIILNMPKMSAEIRYFPPELKVLVTSAAHTLKCI